MAVVISNTDNVLFTNFAASPQSASINVGTATADRLVFVYLFNLDGNNTSAFISSVTIGGVVANNVSAAYITDGTGAGESAIYWALVPSGTSVTLSVQFSVTPTGSSMNALVYSVTGADTATPVADANSGAFSAAITIPVDGGLLAGASAYRVGSVVFGGFTNATADQTALNQAAGIIQMHSHSGLSSTPGLTTVGTSWGTVVASFLSVVAIQPGGPAQTYLFTRQLRY